MRVLKSAVSSIGTRSSCVSLVWILNIAVAWCCRRWTCDPPFPCAVPTVKPVITKVEAKSSTSIQVTWQVSTLRMRRQLFSVQNLCTAAWCAAWSTVPRNTARDFGEKSGVSNSLASPVSHVVFVSWSGKEHRLTGGTPGWVDLICGECEWAVVQMTSSLPKRCWLPSLRIPWTTPLVRGQFLVMRSKAWTSFGLKWWTFTFVTFRLAQDAVDLGYPELRPVGVWPMCSTDIVSWRSTNPLAWLSLLYFSSSRDQPVGSMDRSLRTEFCTNLMGKRRKRRTWGRFQPLQPQSAHWRCGRSTR